MGVFPMLPLLLCTAFIIRPIKGFIIMQAQGKTEKLTAHRTMTMIDLERENAEKWNYSVQFLFSCKRSHKSFRDPGFNELKKAGVYFFPLFENFQQTRSIPLFCCSYLKGFFFLSFLLAQSTISIPQGFFAWVFG